ncbi:hypothetical protein [Nocardia wallacei]|uniref:hypothetical protein n=1 Tax=Nocardia wallacei TaxID=480035 RepID=UPI00245378F1|nr:hypothetical protein [Nocardia wallacei]
MSALRNGSMAIEGRVERVPTDAPKVTFRAGTGEVLAIAIRAAAGPGGRLASLLGSGRERYRIDYPDRSEVWVEPKDSASTSVHRADGAVVGTILRATSATAVAATGGTLFHFVRDPGTPRTPELARLLVLDRSGGELGCVDIGYAGSDPHPDRIAVRGLILRDRVEQDMLLGACVDMTLGLRPYCVEREQGAGHPIPLPE